MMSTQATPIEVLTLGVSPTVVDEQFTIQIYNAYTVQGGIRRGVIVGLQGDVIEDFTAEITQDNHGRQEIGRSLLNQGRGVYLVVLETRTEVIAVKIVKM